MALNVFLKLKGQQQGNILGSAIAKGQDGKIVVIAADHELLSPRDPATGQATGRRQHRPFVITKEVDRSSPLLYRAFASNENLTEWELQFWGANPQGVDVQRYVVALTNASIANIKFHLPNLKRPELAPYLLYEEVSFVYQKIVWTWSDGGITAQDDWISH